MKSDLVDLTLVLHAATARAVRVSDTGEDARAVWLPKSQIEIEHTGQEATAEGRGRQLSRLPVVTVTLPEWLAIDKGLA